MDDNTLYSSFQWRHVRYDFGCFFNIICWPFHYFTIIYEVIIRCIQSFKVVISQHEHLVWCCWILATLPDFSLVTEVPVDFLSFSGVFFRWKSGFSTWSVLNLLKVGTEYVNLSSDSLWFYIDFWFSLWLGKLLFVGMSGSISLGCKATVFNDWISCSILSIFLPMFIRGPLSYFRVETSTCIVNTVFDRVVIILAESL